jgi:hypothetical protein
VVLLRVKEAGPIAEGGRTEGCVGAAKPNGNDIQIRSRKHRLREIASGFLFKWKSLHLLT